MRDAAVGRPVREHRRHDGDTEDPEVAARADGARTIRGDAMSIAAGVRTRVLEGQHRWGRLSVRPVSRTMWSARTLVVFPPGADTRERVLLRAWHAWGVVGAVLAVVVMAAATPRPVLGMVAGCAVYAAGFVLLGRATRRLRPLVRTLTVTTYYGNGRPEVHGDARLLSGSLDALAVTEDALARRRIDPVTFEAVWADVWNTLPSRR